VEVVENQAEWLLQLSERVPNRRERASAARGYGESRELGADPGERSQHVQPEGPPVRMLGCKRNVRDRLGVRGRRHPGTQQNRLSRPGRSRDQGEPTLDSTLDEVE